MEKNLFTEQQERQILKAFDEMDKDLGIDRLDDDASLNRIFKKYQGTAPASSAQQSVNWIDRLGLGWVTQIGKSLASPVYVYASFALIFGLVSVTTFQASQLDSNMGVTDPLRGSEAVFHLDQVGTMDGGLRALIASPQIPRFEVASKDPITLRSDIIESAVGGGLTVLTISEGGTPVIVVIGLEAKSPSHVAFRALAGIPLEVSGNVKVKVVDR